MIKLEKTEGIYGPTLQGEGINIGMPVTFIRLYGCDFRCNWCDTPFSLGKDMGGEFELVDADEIVRRVKAIGCGRVVISGGNPLAQGKNLDPLFEKLYHDFTYQIQVETQGSILPTEMMWNYTKFWSLSPKLPSAGKMESENWKAVKPILEKIVCHRTDRASDHAQLKFVVASAADYSFLKEKLASIRELAEFFPIILQPEGMQHSDVFDYDLYADSLRNLFGWVKSDQLYWMGYDVRVLPQLHKIIWKKERKV